MQKLNEIVGIWPF